jgi:hypothetical protein
MWSYGGFIRDFVYRGDTLQNVKSNDAGMDLDVGLPKNRSMNPSDGCDSVRPWASSVGIKFSRFGQPKGKDVKECFFITLDGKKEFPIEFVDSVGFSNKYGNNIDFDVSSFSPDLFQAGLLRIDCCYFSPDLYQAGRLRIDCCCFAPDLYQAGRLRIDCCCFVILI